MEPQLAVLRAFRGLRPPRELANKVACLPYDVVTTEEARAYAEGNPQCFFHISRPELGLPPGTDEHGESVYRLGRENLLKFQDRQWLIQDPAPALYLYQQRMGQHSQVWGGRGGQRRRLRARFDQEARADAPGQRGRPN